MSKLTKEIDRKVTQEEINDWVTERSKEEIRTKRVNAFLCDLMAVIEAKGEVCEWIVVNADDFQVMMKYAKGQMDMVHQKTVMLDGGIFAYYFTSKVTIDNKLEEPMAYAVDKLPQKYLDRLPLDFSKI